MLNTVIQTPSNASSITSSVMSDYSNCSGLQNLKSRIKLTRIKTNIPK